MAMTDAEVLHAAADLIERVGLHKGTYWPTCPEGYLPGDPVCGVGAVGVVLSLDPIEACQSSAGRALDASYEPGEFFLLNDDPVTTAELMAKTMRACADELDASSG